VRQQQPGRPGPDDPHLGAHATSLVALPPGGCYAERLGELVGGTSVGRDRAEGNSAATSGRDDRFWMRRR
jgi:hypothetical protein